MHPFRVNIDNSTRTKIKKNDIILLDSPYLSEMYQNQYGLVTERYKTLNRNNQMFWNYFIRFKVLTGPKVGKERSVLATRTFEVAKEKMFIPDEEAFSKDHTISPIRIMGECNLVLGLSNDKLYILKNRDGDIGYINDLSVETIDKILENLGNINLTKKVEIQTEKSKEIFKVQKVRNMIGTSFMSYLLLRYDEIKHIFGKPNYGVSGDSKIEREWCISINGNILTIYNYKTGSEYLHKKVKLNDIFPWHIGGANRSSVNMLRLYLNSLSDKYKDSISDKYPSRVI